MLLFKMAFFSVVIPVKIYRAVFLQMYVYYEIGLMNLYMFTICCRHLISFLFIPLSFLCKNRKR